MYKFLTLIVFFLSGTILSAQSPLTITKQNFNIIPTNDSVYSVVQTKLSGVSIPGEGANQLWDYSGLIKENIYYYNVYNSADNSSFPNAFCTSDNNFEVIAVSRGYFYSEYQYLDDKGYYAKGIILENQSYYIGDLSQNPNDSMVAPKQTYTYPSERWLCKFPYTFGSATESKFVRETNYTLTLTAFGLTKTPSLKKAYITQSDSVTGWGKVILPGLSGYKTSPIEVLMTKRIITETDSFFIGGAPAPKMLLDNFALSQGQSTTTAQYLFIRENHKSPLLAFGFQNKTFAKISGITWDISADMLTDVKDNLKNDLSNNIVVSPNPVTDYLKITGDNISRIQIYSIEGIKVLESGFKESISVKDLSSGVYICNLSTGNNNVTKMFVVAR